MELQAARQMIDTLAQGIDPVTGEAMPQDSPYNAPAVIRALVVVSKALDAPPPAVQATDRIVRVRTAPPANAGKAWTAEDDALLESAFAEGADLKTLAERLSRTRFGVEQRLIKLGKIAPAAGGGRFGAAVAP